MTDCRSPTWMVWELAGQPPTPEPEAVAGVCALCGEMAEKTIPAGKAIGPNFTDQYELPARGAGKVCGPCVWSLGGKPPATLRMWTVLARTDIRLPESHPKAPYRGPHLLLTARNDMRPVVEVLADPPDMPWLVSVADSGQKHHLPYAHINHGDGPWTVRMDAVDVTGTPATFRLLLGHVLRLRAAKFSAAEIEAVTPTRLTAETLPVWRAHAEPLTPWRTSPLLHLITFLPNKEHMDEYIDRYGAEPVSGAADRADVAAAGAARDAGRLGQAAAGDTAGLGGGAAGVEAGGVRAPFGDGPGGGGYSDRLF